LLIKTACLTLQKVSCDNVRINVCFVKDRTIKKLNKLHRGKDYATDVLSFNVPKGFPQPDNLCCAGDIIISVDTAARNAKEAGVTLTTELAELLVHGILHLCGYDHENVSKVKGEKMFRLQKKIMKEVLDKKWKA